MSEQMQGRDVEVDGQKVTIYDLSDNPKSWYSAVYQNDATRELDKKFDLTGEPVNKDSDTAHFLRLCTGACSLGKTEVELVLSYFSFLAKQAGNFVGLPEKEFREHVRKGDIAKIDISERFIDIALKYRDAYNDATYLGRMNVEGIDVLFPQNLEKMII